MKTHQIVGIMIFSIAMANFAIDAATDKGWYGKLIRWSLRLALITGLISLWLIND